MQFTQGIGNNLVLEWRNTLMFSASINSAYEKIFEYCIDKIKVRFGFYEGQISFVNLFRTDINSFSEVSDGKIIGLSLEDFHPNPFIKDASFDFEYFFKFRNENNNLNIVSIIIEELSKTRDSFIFCSIHINAAYVICFCDRKLVYNKTINFDSLIELNYHISAISQLYFDKSVSLQIYSSTDNYRELTSFLKLYFNDIYHLYCPVSKICINLDTSRILECNLYLINLIIKYFKR